MRQFENLTRWVSMNSRTDSNFLSFSSKVAGSWGPDFETKPSLGRSETIMASQSVPQWVLVTLRHSLRWKIKNWPGLTLIPVKQRINFSSFLRIWWIKQRSWSILIRQVLRSIFILMPRRHLIIVRALRTVLALGARDGVLSVIWKSSWRIARDSHIDKSSSTRVGTQWAGLYFKNSGWKFKKNLSKKLSLFGVRISDSHWIVHFWKNLIRLFHDQFLKFSKIFRKTELAVKLRLTSKLIIWV